MSDTIEDNSFLFLQVLATIPVDDLCRALTATQIFLLRILSTKIKNIVDNMHLCINVFITSKNKLIIESLKNVIYFHKIVKISITGCAFFMDLILPLIQEIKEIKTLKNLNLSNNNIGNNFNILCIKCTANKNQLFDLQKIKLHTLDISNNYIGPKDFEILTKILFHNSTLTSLNMASNNIGSEGAIILAKALSQNKVIKKLIISNNCIGEEGAIEIAKIIPNCTSLTSLDLSYNCIGLEGFMCLSRVQSQNSTLTSLNLNHNNIRLFQEWDAI
jgi:Ran GTPase-activating protein (RanGAP) involved in mRNA processing and transport